LGQLKEEIKKAGNRHGEVLLSAVTIQKIIVNLNLFQYLLKKMLKRVQHDKKSLDSRLRGNDIQHFFRTMQQYLHGFAMTEFY
jgi:hypothetical protein